jgi:hypothetical protein
MRASDFIKDKPKDVLTIFDIDDTLFHTTAKINVIKDGEVVRSLTNQEFNNYELEDGEEYDFGEFRNAEKFRQESKPIGPMLDELKTILDHSRGKVIMLTARSDFDNKDTFLQTFKDHGIDMSKIHVHRAGNLPGNEPPAQKKAVWVRKYLNTGKYNRVSLYDDSMSNLRVFKELEEEYPDVEFDAYHITGNGDVSSLEERKRRGKRKSKRVYGAAWGPGPYGLYGANVGYSGVGSVSSSDGGAGDGGGGGMEEASLGVTLSWPEFINKISSAMKAMGWKVQRKGDGEYMFSTRGQASDDEYYIVIVENLSEGWFKYALGTVEEGDPYIGEEGNLPATEASVSELLELIRDGYGISLNEAWTPNKKQRIKDFALWAIKLLEIERAPRIKLVNDTGTTALGYFDVENEVIVVTVKDRHQMDIMRTLAHELVHRKQKEFKQDLDGSTGSVDENEANAMAGVLLRQWGKKNPGLFTESLVKTETNKLIPYPKGTVKVDVDDVYDWYKLGMNISDLDDADPKDFGKGPPQTVLSFGSEPIEHKYLKALKRLKLKTRDIDPPGEKDVDENFADGKNPQDKGDSARHGIRKGMDIADLKKIRSSDSASPRKKQLAHWQINMRQGKKK